VRLCGGGRLPGLWARTPKEIFFGGSGPSRAKRMKDLRKKRQTASSSTHKTKCGQYQIGKPCTESRGCRSGHWTKSASPVKKIVMDSPCLLTALVKCSLSDQISISTELCADLSSHIESNKEDILTNHGFFLISGDEERTGAHFLCRYFVLVRLLRRFIYD
jgi:hypothetical protein